MLLLTKGRSFSICTTFFCKGKGTKLCLNHVKWFVFAPNLHEISDLITIFPIPYLSKWIITIIIVSLHSQKHHLKILITPPPHLTPTTLTKRTEKFFPLKPPHSGEIPLTPLTLPLSETTFYLLLRTTGLQPL